MIALGDADKERRCSYVQTSYGSSMQSTTYVGRDSSIASAAMILCIDLQSMTSGMLIH